MEKPGSPPGAFVRRIFARWTTRGQAGGQVKRRFSSPPAGGSRGVECGKSGEKPGRQNRPLSTEERGQVGKSRWIFRENRWITSEFPRKAAAARPARRRLWKVRDFCLYIRKYKKTEETENSYFSLMFLMMSLTMPLKEESFSIRLSTFWIA